MGRGRIEVCQGNGVGNRGGEKRDGLGFITILKVMTFGSRPKAFASPMKMLILHPNSISAALMAYGLRAGPEFPRTTDAPSRAGPFRAYHCFFHDFLVAAPVYLP